MYAHKIKQAYQIQGTYHSKIFRQPCILNCFHRRNHTGHVLLPTLCHCHSLPPACFEKMGESTRQIQSSGKQAEAGLPSFEANHRRAFLLELIRYFWAKKQCSFASQTFQIITAAIAIKGCSPALLNLYVYDCKVNVCVVRSALKICFQPIFLADQISCSFL